MSDEIRVYVADLAAYNNGKLHGVWINATDDLDDIQEQVNQMLDESPEQGAEEYALHDYEGFNGYGLGEYESIGSVHEIAAYFYNRGHRILRSVATCTKPSNGQVILT